MDSIWYLYAALAALWCGGLGVLLHQMMADRAARRTWWSSDQADGWYYVALSVVGMAILAPASWVLS